MVRANVSKVWARSLRTTVACRTGARLNTSAHISAGRSSGGFPFVVNDSTLRLDELPGGVQRCGPQVVQQLPEPGQALRPGTVQPAGAVAPLGQQPGVLQHGQVLADRGTGHLERRGDLAGRQLLVCDETQDGAPARLGEGPQRLVGGRVGAPGAGGLLRPTARPGSRRPRPGCWSTNATGRPMVSLPFVSGDER